MPRSSIIIPTRERPHLLRRAVESARFAGSDVEIVVVDDASVDETAAVCATLADVVYVRLPEQRGVGYARNAGVLASSAEFISFLDDDDVRLPGTIDRQIAALRATPSAAMVYGQVFMGRQDLSLSGQQWPAACPRGDVFWELLESNFIPSISVVVRRGVLNEVGGPVAECAPADDWDLWLRIAERHPVTALAEPVAIWRQATLWSSQGSSRFVEGLLPADLHVLDRCATMDRVRANPEAFQRAGRRIERGLCERLLADALRAARHRDPYAWTSLRHAMEKPGALMRVLTAPRNWRALWRALFDSSVLRRMHL